MDEWLLRSGQTRRTAQARRRADHLRFGSVEGPPQIAGPRARYGLDGATAHDLFDGKLVQVWSSQTPTPDEADPSGQYYAPENLAERLGFRGFSWKVLTTGCRTDGADTHIYFSGANTAAFRSDDFVVMIKRK
jgi:hypothetical protein